MGDGKEGRTESRGEGKVRNGLKEQKRGWDVREG